MVGVFQWTEIFSIAGWPLWVVIGCNSLILTLLFERLWYVWKPFRSILGRFSWITGKKISKHEWETLYFKESRRVHTCLPLIRNLIFVCPMAGLLGSLFHLSDLTRRYGLDMFSEPAMEGYLFIKLALPVLAGFCSALFGIITLSLYVRGLKLLLCHPPFLSDGK